MTRSELFAKREKKRKQQKQRRLFYGGIGAIAVIALVMVIWFATSPLRDKKTEEGTSGEAGAENVSGDTVSELKVEDDAGSAGWNVDDNGWWYKTADNQKVVSGWKTIDGNQYYFDDNGYILTGWQYVDGDNYVCFSESGIYQPDAQVKYVALTFDDGPSWDTDTILDTLEAYHARATFFVVGSMADLDDTCRNALKREYNDGMEVGSHTWDHTTLLGASAETISSVMDKNDEYIQSMIGFTPVLMRPTGGGIDDTVRSTVTKPMILWDVDTRDWESLDAQKTFAAVQEGVQNGSIVLMHDIYIQTAEAVKLIVPWLSQNGYRMVTVSELASLNGVTLEVGKTYTDFHG